MSGSPYFDSVAIKVVSDNQLEQTDKKAGKVVSTGTATISQDGNTIRYEFSDSSNTNGGRRRVAPGWERVRPVGCEIPTAPLTARVKTSRALMGRDPESNCSRNYGASASLFYPRAVGFWMPSRLDNHLLRLARSAEM